MNVKVELSKCGIDVSQLGNYQKNVDDAIDELWSDNNPYTQWVKLPMRVNRDELEEMFMTAIAAQDSCGLFVIVGNGGAYLGIKAAIEAIEEKVATAPEVEFVGEGISHKDFSRVLERMRHYEVNVCVISKSGETAETIAAYQVIKEYMFNRYGDAVAPKRIMIMTGEGENTLKSMADKDGCGIFNISKNYIGNYGILSPASLFPMAVAGIEVDRLLAGAEVMATDSSWDIDAGNYAVARKLLNEQGKIVEIFQYSQSNLESLAIWISHLFMESDGKQDKGLYTTTMNIARDYKAKGQFMAGSRKGFVETEIIAREVEADMNLPQDLAQLIPSETVAQLNKSIMETIKAVADDEERDCIKIEVPKMDAFNLGQIIYFFLMSASISAHMFGVDPFERSFIDKIKDKLKINR
ncbi:MAG: hypothetical protein U0K95_02530 [Eubacterium sp.]|nr:hypothetical protein [Eubacterium sp.]